MSYFRTNFYLMTVRERIIELATSMFMHKGIKAITMDDIARESGVSKRTIYENFHDKDDLLRHCLAYLDAQYHSRHEQMVAETPNVIQTIFGIMKQAVAAIRQINPLFSEDLKKYHNKVWRDVYGFMMEKQHRQILTILKKGINQGFFRKEINIEVVAVLQMHQMRITSDRSVFPDEQFSPVVVFENVMMLFLRGIATPKGLEVIDGLMQDDEIFSR